jgi:hypothetical protein
MHVRIISRSASNLPKNFPKPTRNYCLFQRMSFNEYSKASHNVCMGLILKVHKGFVMEKVTLQEVYLGLLCPSSFHKFPILICHLNHLGLLTE